MGQNKRECKPQPYDGFRGRFLLHLLPVFSEDTVGEPKKWGTSLEKDAFFLTKWGSHLLFFARMRYRWGNISRKTGFANSITFGMTHKTKASRAAARSQRR